jgi:hypothetical protein
VFRQEFLGSTSSVVRPLQLNLLSGEFCMLALTSFKFECGCLEMEAKLPWDMRYLTVIGQSSAERNQYESNPSRDD